MRGAPESRVRDRELSGWPIGDKFFGKMNPTSEVAAADIASHCSLQCAPGGVPSARSQDPKIFGGFPKMQSLLGDDALGRNFQLKGGGE
jgi:hypothetical protein